MTEAAEAVGYVPNAAARSLRSRRTGQIAFAMPDVANPVYTAMVGSIQEVAREPGGRLLLHSTGADADDELAIVRDLKQRFVDGLILCLAATSPTSTSPSSRRAAAPVVVIGTAAEGHARRHRPRRTRARGAAEAVRHLHAAGRRRIAFVNGPAAHGAGQRRAGSATSTACARAGSSATRTLVEVADDFMVEPGRPRRRAAARARAARRDLLRQRPARRRRARRAARRQASTCRSDVAVVGMDNTAPLRA